MTELDMIMIGFFGWIVVCLVVAKLYVILPERKNRKIEK